MGGAESLRRGDPPQNVGRCRAMMFSPPPCKDCVNRYIGCHNEDACFEFRDWKKEEKRKNAELEKARSEERFFQEMRFQKDTRICRRKHSAQTRGHYPY